MEYPGVSVACRWVWIASFLEGASPVLDTLTSSAQGWTVISVTTTMTIKIRFVNFFLGAFPINSCALLFVLVKNGTFTLYGRPYKKTIIQGVFFTGPPPKKLKYGKLRLGEVRCI